MTTTDKRLIGARVPQDFAEKVEAAAAKAEPGGSLSSFVRRALAAALEPKPQHRGEAA